MSPLPRRLRPEPSSEVLALLMPIRNGFLQLHKALLEAERRSYELVHGRVSNAQFLQLLINEPSLAWLQPLLKFVVTIDEALEAETAITLPMAYELMQTAKALLKPNETGSVEAQRFSQLLQDNDVVHVYAELRRYLHQQDAHRHDK